jgi:hypothetical protein
MSTITDEEMWRLLPTTREYTVVILRARPQRDRADAEEIIWEHGRRNFQLRADGPLAVVCPVVDGTDVAGIAIFSTDREQTVGLMDADPGVQAGVFVYEVHPCRGFPGDALPG